MFPKIIDNFIKNNYISERNFARMFSEKYDIKLDYTQSINSACTNGNVIKINPEMDKLYADSEIFEEAEKLLNWQKLNVAAIRSTTGKIYIIAHALLIHECLHLIYTDFSTGKTTDDFEKQYMKIIHNIHNIIEDAYIEAAGSERFRYVRYYLQFLNTILGIKNNLILEQTQAIQKPPITKFIRYIAFKILYPITKQPKPDEDIKEAVEKIEPLFYKAIQLPTCNERYEASKEIVKKLLELGIEMNEESPMPQMITLGEALNSLRSQVDQQGESQPINSLLYQNINLNDYSDEENTEDDTDNPGKSKEENNDEEDKDEKLKDFLSELVKKINEAQENNITDKTSSAEENIINSNTYENINHKDIIIRENYPQPKKSDQIKYEEIQAQYKSIIKKYNHKFNELIQQKTVRYDGKYNYGVKINSKNLQDPKKRFWTRRTDDVDNADLAVQILIDGSGSMYGKKNKNAINASILLHEILAANKIPHSITEFRTRIEKEVDHNTFIRFNFKPNDKYNLVNIKADGCNRDGLALIWAIKKLQKRSEEDKIIIIISDGQPTYNTEEGIVTDFKNIQKETEAKKIKIIAIALEENKTEIYNNLKQYYKNVLSCNNPEKLPKQLANLISTLIQK